MRILGVSWEEVREARRLDGLHLRIKVEGLPRTKGWDINGVGDLILLAVAFGFMAGYLGAPLLLVAGGAWLPIPEQGALRTLLEWTMLGLAVVCVPLWGASEVGTLDSFLALHGPRRRALFLHRVTQFGPRLFAGSLAWGGAMAGRMASSGIPFRDAVLLPVTAALLPPCLAAFVALKSTWPEGLGIRDVTTRFLLVIGMSCAGVLLAFLSVLHLADQPPSGAYPADGLLRWFACIAPCVLLVAGATLAMEALRSFEAMEIAPGKGRKEVAGPVSKHAKLPDASGAPHPFPQRKPRTILSARLLKLGGMRKYQIVIVVAFIAVSAFPIAIGFALPLSASQEYRPWYLLPLVLCLVPMGAMTHRQRAWLLGMDLVAQRWHNWAFVCAVQVPVFCGSAALFAMAWGGGAQRWSLVALMAAIIAFRLGARGWEEFARRTGWRSFLPRIPVYVLAIGLLLSPMAGWEWALVAAGGGVVLGLVGMGIETQLISEETLLDGMRREAEAG
jgi:hypothetical protein